MKLRRIVFCKSLPRNSTEKILRRDLRELEKSSCETVQPPSVAGAATGRPTNATAKGATPMNEATLAWRGNNDRQC
jgi:hypothetical protein